MSRVTDKDKEFIDFIRTDVDNVIKILEEETFVVYGVLYRKNIIIPTEQLKDFSIFIKQQKEKAKVPVCSIVIMSEDAYRRLYRILDQIYESMNKVHEIIDRVLKIQKAYLELERKS